MQIDTNTISFTYGDSHPTFNEKVNEDGNYGPARYVEAHIGSGDVIRRYIASIKTP